MADPSNHTAEVAAEVAVDGDSARIAGLVPEAIRALTAYHVPSAEGMLKLDAMENPHQLPDALKRQWLARLGEVAVNRYPDPQSTTLKKVLRATFGIPAGSGLVLGNGSDELIQMIALLVGGRGRTILAPTPTFAMYELIAAATGGAFAGVPLRANFSLDGDALLGAIRQHRPACVFLAWPNNPGGNCFEEAVIEEVLRQAPGLVVLDEAYHAFCRRSFLDRLGEFPRLMVLRTLSKSGMAGLRLGALSAHPSWAEQLEKVRLPYNINSLTQCSAAFYLEHYDVIRRQAASIVREREVLFGQLAERPGLHPYPSEANFILFRVAGDAQRVHARLKEQGVLIKNLHRTGPLLQNCLRVTVGAESENRRFLAALDNSLNPPAAARGGRRG